VVGLEKLVDETELGLRDALLLLFGVRDRERGRGRFRGRRGRRRRGFRRERGWRRRKGRLTILLRVRLREERVCL